MTVTFTPNNCSRAARIAKCIRGKTMRVAGGLLLAALAIAACGGSRSSRPEPGGGDPYLILAAELESSRQLNVYDAVQKLRPIWFTRRVGNRSGEDAISVYFEDQLVGTRSALRRVSVFGVDRVRYMSPSEAQTRFGQQNRGRAAVVVELQR